MTIPKQQSFLPIVAIAATLLLSFALASLYEIGRANAQEPELELARGAGGPYRPLYAQADTGSSSRTIPPPPLDAYDHVSPPVAPPQLRNPVDDPVGAVDDMRNAKELGWGAAILAGLVMLTAGFSRASQRWPNSRLFAWFAKNHTAIFVVSGLSAVAAAAFNTLALGGTWTAVMFTAGAAGLALLAPMPQPPRPPAS